MSTNTIIASPESDVVPSFPALHLVVVRVAPPGRGPDQVPVGIDDHGSRSSNLPSSRFKEGVESVIRVRICFLNVGSRG